MEVHRVDVIRGDLRALTHRWVRVLCCRLRSGEPDPAREVRRPGGCVRSGQLPLRLDPALGQQVLTVRVDQRADRQCARLVAIELQGRKEFRGLDRGQ